jgi:hypothetical protein
MKASANPQLIDLLRRNFEHIERYQLEVGGAAGQRLADDQLAFVIGEVVFRVGQPRDPEGDSRSR